MQDCNESPDALLGSGILRMAQSLLRICRLNERHLLAILGDCEAGGEGGGVEWEEGGCEECEWLL